MFDGGREVGIATTVGERVRSDVEDPHHDRVILVQQLDASRHR
jgi:hypothetical protein